MPRFYVPRKQNPLNEWSVSCLCFLPSFTELIPSRLSFLSLHPHSLPETLFPFVSWDITWLDCPLQLTSIHWPLCIPPPTSAYFPSLLISTSWVISSSLMISTAILMLINSKWMFHHGPLLNSKLISVYLASSFTCPMSFPSPKPNSCPNQSLDLQLTPHPNVPNPHLSHLNGNLPSGSGQQPWRHPSSFLFLHPPSSTLVTSLDSTFKIYPASEHSLPPSLLPPRSRLWVSCIGWLIAAASIWTQCLCVGPPFSVQWPVFFFLNSGSQTWWVSESQKALSKKTTKNRSLSTVKKSVPLCLLQVIYTQIWEPLFLKHEPDESFLKWEWKLKLFTRSCMAWVPATPWPHLLCLPSFQPLWPPALS